MTVKNRPAKLALTVSRTVFSGPIPYGVTVHPFADITVRDNNPSADISANIGASGAGNSTLTGMGLVGYGGSAHGTSYAISSKGPPGFPPLNLPPISAAQMTADLRSMTYTSTPPDPADAEPAVGISLTDGSLQAFVGFLPADVAQIVTMQPRSLLVTSIDPPDQDYIQAHENIFHVLDGEVHATVHSGQTAYDFSLNNAWVWMSAGDFAHIPSSPAAADIVHMGSGTETLVEDIPVPFFADSDNQIHAGSGTDSIFVGTDVVSIYGGSGATHVNLRAGLGFGSSGMTFIGGEGYGTVVDVGYGYGGAGKTALFGANGAMLYDGASNTALKDPQAASGTWFALANAQDNITVETFRPGKDFIMLAMTPQAEAHVLATQTYANGVDTLITGASAAAGGVIAVHTTGPLTARNIELIPGVP